MGRRRETNDEPDQSRIIMRIGLYTFLILAVTGIAFEARARSNAINTRDKWREQRDTSINRGSSFTAMDLKRMIVGSPWVENGRLDDHQNHAVAKRVYAWKGPFMSYDIRVYFLPRGEVAFIDGPGSQREK